MTDTPPFDPPYRTITHTPTGVHVVETLADGSTRVVDATESDSAARNLGRQTKQVDAAAAPDKRATSLPVKASGNHLAVVYLQVPFAEKDKAKAAGAKWDASERKWFAPHGVDINQFKRWWPDTMKQEMDGIR